jgi:hypothetical protein
MSVFWREHLGLHNLDHMAFIAAAPNRPLIFEAQVGLPRLCGGSIGVGCQAAVVGRAVHTIILGFLTGKVMTANQIEFIDLSINHLTEHGIMGAALLYESPSTDLAPHGPEDLFTSDEVDRLVSVLDQIRAVAVAA